MGRGLSELQKTILMVGANEEKAERSRESLRKSLEGMDQSHPLFALFSRPSSPYRVNSSTVYDICYPPPAPITPANRVAMSKAFKRLVQRGLIEERNGRICWFLTPAGVAMGQELMANSSAELSRC